ncbi:MAG: hypothetical protein LBG90_06080 [Spirochaetaceae bacterium]|jgi:hypothetical protein|nr:hypothetical protein [Spirochaetaceae bacterium]
MVQPKKKCYDRMEIDEFWTYVWESGLENRKKTAETADKAGITLGYDRD